MFTTIQYEQGTQFLTIEHDLVIATVWCGLGPSRVRVGNIMEEQETVIVSDLYVHSAYRGQGHGSRLLRYALHTCSRQYPLVRYSTLDDMSDQSYLLGENIYEKIGYEWVDPPTETNGTWKPVGPERQLDLNDLNNLE